MCYKIDIEIRITNYAIKIPQTLNTVEKNSQQSIVTTHVKSSPSLTSVEGEGGRNQYYDLQKMNKKINIRSSAKKEYYSFETKQLSTVRTLMYE